MFLAPGPSSRPKIGTELVGKWGTHAIAESATKLAHAFRFECSFTCMVVKCTIIESLRLWNSELDCGEVQSNMDTKDVEGDKHWL